MRTATLITTVAAVLVLGACGDDDDRPSKPVGANAAPKAAVRPLPEISDSVMSPGSYEAKVFRPGLSLEIPKDSTWRLVGNQSERHVGMGALADQPIRQAVIAFHRLDVVADPRRGARTLEDAVKAPADVIDWLARHPHLDAGEPQDVEVAGVSGRMIEVTPKSQPRRVPDECTEGGFDCVPMYFDQEEPVIFPIGTRQRFHVLDVGDEPVVVEMFSDPLDQFDRVIALLEPVLRSVQFTSER